MSHVVLLVVVCCQVFVVIDEFDVGEVCLLFVVRRLLLFVAC